MRADLLEYNKEYQHFVIANERCCYLGQVGNKYCFVSVRGKNSTICSGEWWLTKDQIEKLIAEL